MHVVGEPFLTREAIATILRLGQVPTESQFRTLRAHGAASRGLPVAVRARAGHIVGSLRLYNALNADAARAFRLKDRPLARELAARAEEIEASPSAVRVRDAVASSATRTTASGEKAPSALRQYVEARRASWGELDRRALTREWLTHSEAWFTLNYDTLLESVLDLTAATEKVRAELIPETHASTFYGVVARMDDRVAEVEADDGQALLVLRDDLDRQGLAVLGKPVAVLREVLPGGGAYSLPMPAVAVDRCTMEDRSPFTERLDFGDDGAYATMLEDSDWRWVKTLFTGPRPPMIASPLPVS